MSIPASLFNPEPIRKSCRWAPSPQSIITNSPSLRITIEGRPLLRVGVAELVPRKMTSSLTNLAPPQDRNRTSQVPVHVEVVLALHLERLTGSYMGTLRLHHDHNPPPPEQC